MSIDHINLDKLDNRILNLRLADSSKNSCNTGLRSDNTSGVKGVYYNNRDAAWFGRVTYKGKRYTTGPCPTVAVAEGLLKELRNSLHKEFTNHGK